MGLTVAVRFTASLYWLAAGPTAAQVDEEDLVAKVRRSKLSYDERVIIRRHGPAPSLATHRGAK